MRQTSLIIVLPLVLASCASRSASQDRGYFLSHDETVARCGVGNYVDRDTICEKHVAVYTQQQVDISRSASANPRREIEKLLGEMDHPVHFETGKAVLSSSDRNHLEKIAHYLRQDDNLRLSVSGHADATGTDAINRPLSQARAEAVTGVLTEQGVDRSQVVVKNYGSRKPVESNQTAEGRAMNRRAEIDLQ